VYNIRYFCTVIGFCWFRYHIIIAHSMVMDYLKFNTQSFMIINKPTFVTHTMIQDKFAFGSCVTVFRCFFLTERTYDLLSIILGLCNSAVSTVLVMHGYMNGGCHK